MLEYFDIFDLPPKLNLDATDLQRRFHQLSRQHHPDYHTTVSDEERERALRTTALLNDAYRTLRDATRRVEYLVQAHGFTVDGSKVPQSLLAEVFEINEELEQLREARTRGESGDSSRSSLEGFRRTLAERREAYDTRLNAAADRWDQMIDAGVPDGVRREHLSKLADIVAESAYLRNLEREIQEEVSE